ncbi:MAG: cell cycle transcriptional regulator TrcR, partial [Pseudomonadota bacterium]
GQLTRDEIAKAEADANHVLKISEAKVQVPQLKKKGPRYTPVSKRQDRPNAILWLVRNHPELKDAQISRLAGTTKNTIQQIRERTHWNSANLQPIDPVALGLCTQIDLDFEVNRAAKNRPAEPVVEASDETLMPASQTEGIALEDESKAFEPSKVEDDEIDADAVFAKLKSLKSDDADPAPEE